MIDKKDIIQAAIAIKPHLHKIMQEEDAHQMEVDLENLLARASTEENVENLILARLTDQDDIRQWLQKTFQDTSNNRESFSKGENEPSGTQGYGGLAGDPRPISSPKYVCSYFGCGFEFYLNKAGMRIPDCLIHKVPLIQAVE